MPDRIVSLDEYLNSKGRGGVERKHFARDDGVVIKAAPSGIVEKAKFDKAAGTMKFVMSAEVPDRDRDIVVAAGIDVQGFEKNPVAPWSHRSGDMPVGKWSDVTKLLGGRPKRLEGLLNLTKGDPVADRLAIHLEAGSVAACSIGFMPLEIERREVPDDGKGDYYYPGYTIHSCELFECSPCVVPANPLALAKAAAGGDVLAREMIEQVLDNWDLKDGLLVPRKAFEDAHRAASPEKTTVTVKGIMEDVKKAITPLKAAITLHEGHMDGSMPTSEDSQSKMMDLMKQSMSVLTSKGMKAAEPTQAERVIDDVTKDAGLVDRFLTALGLKGRTDAADPAPEQDGVKPAPEPTPEEKLKAQFAADLPALTAKHEMLEADARVAALDAEMAKHAA